MLFLRRYSLDVIPAPLIFVSDFLEAAACFPFKNRVWEIGKRNAAERLTFPLCPSYKIRGGGCENAVESQSSV